MCIRDSTHTHTHTPHKQINLFTNKWNPIIILSKLFSSKWIFILTINYFVKYVQFIQYLPVVCLYSLITLLAVITTLSNPGNSDPKTEWSCRRCTWKVYVYINLKTSNLHKQSALHFKMEWQMPEWKHNCNMKD